MLKSLASGLSRLIVDLTPTVSLDSTTLGVLITGKQRAVQQGGDLIIVCASARTRRIFALTRLERLLQIYATVEEALSHG